MGRLRYIGSKARLTAQIFECVGASNGGRFVDAFCGTGIVSRAAVLKGWAVLANDTLRSSAIMAAAQMTSKTDVGFVEFGGYTKAIDRLNKCSPKEGFIFREYAPSGKSLSGHKRLYFTVENASIIDAIRELIHEWRKKRRINLAEETLLIADLLESANRVANIAGTYGCFLSRFCTSAMKKLELRPRNLIQHPAKFWISSKDATGLKAKENDTVYLDPPYTKRQYAAYYHLLETIAFGDEPQVGGVTGLRPWESKASVFCYKAKALPALVDLAVHNGAQRVLISYNSQGHIQINELATELAKHGMVNLIALGEIGRYRPNEKSAANGESVAEFLIDFAPGGPTSEIKETHMPKNEMELAL